MLPGDPGYFTYVVRDIGNLERHSVNSAELVSDIAHLVLYRAVRLRVYVPLASCTSASSVGGACRTDPMTLTSASFRV